MWGLGSRYSIASTSNGRFISTITVPNESSSRGCFICDKVIYLVNDYSYHVLRAIHLLPIKGKSSKRGARERGNGTHGGGSRSIQSSNGCGYCYAIPTRLEVEASNTIIVGIVPICFRFAIVLFDLE